MREDTNGRFWKISKHTIWGSFSQCRIDNFGEICSSGILIDRYVRIFAKTECCWKIHEYWQFALILFKCVAMLRRGSWKRVGIFRYSFIFVAGRSNENLVSRRWFAWRSRQRSVVKTTLETSPMGYTQLFAPPREIACESLPYIKPFPASERRGINFFSKSCCGDTYSRCPRRTMRADWSQQSFPSDTKNALFCLPCFSFHFLRKITGQIR